MIDLYAIIAFTFGVAGYYISGGMPVFLLVAGAGIGVCIGVAYLFTQQQGQLFSLAVVLKIMQVIYGSLKRRK